MCIIDWTKKKESFNDFQKDKFCMKILIRNEIKKKQCIGIEI